MEFEDEIKYLGKMLKDDGDLMSKSHEEQVRTECVCKTKEYNVEQVTYIREKDDV